MKNISKTAIQFILIAITSTAFAAVPYDPARAKACENYVASRSERINKYTGKKYSIYTWLSLYETIGMWKSPDDFGENYILPFGIMRTDKDGVSIGGLINYYCLSDPLTKKVISFVPSPNH